MLQQIKDKLKQYRLREGFGAKKDFKVSNVVNPASITKWAKADNDTKEQIKLFKAAKAGDKSALEYIFYKMGPTIQKSFWTIFLGPNPKQQQRRITTENAWEDWLGIAWQTLTGGFSDRIFDEDREIPGKVKLVGAIDSFDVDKLKPGTNPLLLFGNRYKLMLRNSAGNANYGTTTGGIKDSDITLKTGAKTVQYEPTWYEKGGENDYNPDGDDLDAGASPGYEDNTFEGVNTRMNVESFIPRWKQFTQDPELLQGTKGVNIGQLFFEVISNPNADYADMVKKFGLARNTIASNLQKAIQTLSKYNITHEDLVQAIKVLGNDKVGSYFGGIISQKSKSEEKPKNIEFKSSFQTATSDPKMWKPHVKGADAGNVLFWWIDENFPTLDKLSTEYGLKFKDMNWFFVRAMKVLKKHGIDESAIKNAVKKYGKKAITNLIGEDA